ncbi:MAG: S8 family serine peptidase [Pirellulaceae bacterium]
MRPADRSRSLQRRSRYETFEQRLALTAQPLGEMALGIDQQLQHHYSELAPAEVVNPIGDFQLEAVVEEHVSNQADSVSGAGSNVHDLTGVSYVFNNYGFTGQGQTVAIIDSGIAWDHVALGGGFGSEYRVVGGYDFAEGDADPYDDGPSGFHGTHVAGIVGSSDAEHRGVASGVDLVGLRVFDDNGAGYFSLVEDALQWVHDHRNDFEHPITTVNLSLGTTWNAASVPSWATLEDEFAQLAADGIFIAVSAGNSFSEYGSVGLSYPAASPYVVPVASVDSDGTISNFSQRNDRVLAAPGSYITSTVPDHVFGADGNPNDFGTSSGTSMASPYVAGASVLVRQAMDFVGIQDVTQTTIYNHLRTTADIVYDAATSASYHLINLEAAINALMPSDDFGSTTAAAHALGTVSNTTSFVGVIGSVSDADYFTFTAGQTGQATFAFDSTHELVLDASVVGGAGSFANDTLTLDVVAGQSYTFFLTTVDGVGHYAASVSVASVASGNEQSGDRTQSGGSGSSGEQKTTVDPIAKAAYDLDQAKGLKFSGNDHLNWGGTNEKWLLGSDGWYFIRPGGEVYKWVGFGNAKGTLVATLDASYYADLSKLYDAKPPATSGSQESSNDAGSTETGANTGTEAGTGTADGGSESANDNNSGTGDSKSSKESTLAARARELDSQYGFTTDGNYIENWAGHGEKWFRSNTLGWVFITPDGSLYDWNGNRATALKSPKIAQLDASFYQDPTLLTDPPADSGSSSGGQSGSSGDKSTDSEQGSSDAGGGTSSGGTKSKDDSNKDANDSDSKTESALATRARELDSRYGFTTDGQYHENWAGHGEKWFRSVTLGWVFITPDGSLYDWNGNHASAMNSPKIARLDASFHQDPTLLTDPPATAASMSLPAVKVEDSITVIDTHNSVWQYAHHNVTSHRTLAWDHVLASTGGPSEPGEGGTIATSRVNFFAEYELNVATRYHDPVRLASTRFAEDERLAVDRVYQALEADAIEESVATLTK